MSENIAVLRKRAMYDPESLSNAEWRQIHKVAFSVPKKDFADDAETAPMQKQKRKKGWW